MSGGFIPSASYDPPEHHANSSNNIDQDRKPDIGPEPLLKLTPRQEARLRDHVDKRLADLERDSKTHGFESLPALLNRLRPLLRLILQIPPVEPWASLRTSYLLALSGSIMGYITSLPLSPDAGHAPGEVEDEGDEGDAAGRTMGETIDFLNEVDRAWRTVLKGQAWVVDPDSGVGKGVRVDYGGSVNQTERIRLRSIVISGRARILAWARTYGSFPGAAIGMNGAQTPERQVVQLEDWETEIMGVWNGILDMLSGSEANDDSDNDDEQQPGLDAEETHI